jgi:ABC-type phosphate transport system permease subunit
MSQETANPQPSPKRLVAAGEPKVWLCGLGLTLGITMVIVLLGYIFIKGMEVFTPKPIRLYEIEAVQDETTTTESFLGEFRRAQTRSLPGQEPVELSNLFVGSREFGGAFRWVQDEEILSQEIPENAMRIERMEMGFVLGIPIEVRLGGDRIVKADAPDFRKEVDKALEEVVERRAEIRSLELGEIGNLAGRITKAKLQIRGYEMNERLSSEERERKVADVAAQIAKWEEESQKLIAKSAAMREEQKKYTLVYDIIRREEPVELSFENIVSIEQPNALSAIGKATTFTSRLWNFVTAWPRDANTDGGIWPAIFGTFIMTIVMSIFVTPFGVVAAIYLREYATQGMMVRAVRISVNNLAGVPSIVFGVFGVAFFIYTLGGFVDGGPTNPVETGTFWMLAIAFIILTFAAVGSSIHISPKPGRASASETMRMLTTTLWVSVVVIAIAMIWKNPFFSGFYRTALPTPTFGTGGILWASLTLALLTLPVVIVATEEALSAVPRGVREAALASGASKWQMIQRVVLPASTPGIMTGVILAMARGAGEVAPLMLVGVIPAASTLVVDGVSPFIHAERKFMHLGFHIYDVGFQSPDSEAARPLVFATTFILILLVVAMNLAAIMFRNRLRKRLQTNAF